MSASSNSVFLTTSNDFHQAVLEAAGPVLVEFTASWCAPCRALAPVLEELGRRHAGRVRVAVVDVEASPELAQAHRVTAMPTLIAFHRGQVVAHAIGFGGRARVEKLFDELAALPPSPMAAATATPSPTPPSRTDRRAP
ncbi:MAG TPA: thioredoxin family protein [Kofleriaceae bacterium]|nr:thioredoxin family protein [Kofleriaceae bacterium]